MTPLSPDERQFYEALRSPFADGPATRAAVIIAGGVSIGAVLYTSASLLAKSYGLTFFSIPFFVGLIVALASPTRPYRNTLWALFASLVLSVLTLREGVICALFSLPVVAPLAFLGAFCGRTLRVWLRTRRLRQGAGAMGLLLALAWQAVDGAYDDPSRHPHHHALASVEIAASDAAVFAALTQQPIEVKGSFPWFIEIGLPIAKRLEVFEPKLGGRVRLTQSTGVADGHVTAWSPSRAFSFTVDRYVTHDLPFRITRLGRSPDYGFRAERVDDWLTIVSVDYRIEPLPDGRARLTRSMQWQRHLAPDLYFGWLQQSVMERGQQRLLSLLRETMETRRSPDPTGPRLVRR